MNMHLIAAIAFISVVAILSTTAYFAAKHADKKYNK
jgi:hypothetical protein